jgi:hypothetical protein
LLSDHNRDTQAIDAMHRVYATIASIDFGTTWENLRKNDKADVFEALFCDLPARRQQFEGLNAKEARAAITQHFSNDFEKWKKAFRKYELTPRIKLANIYQTVRFHCNAASNIH